jgi:hypothetical protein
MKIGSLGMGSRGLDCNQPLTTADLENIRRWNAKRGDALQYRFAIRYIRRTTQHDYDVSCSEISRIFTAGLGLMLVQHVAPEGWRPSSQLGAEYGATAASEALSVLYPAGATLWCDLEGVAAKVPAADVIAYCNAWYDAVVGAGYLPGLYVGDSCGLNASDLYYKLKFTLYWSAYNLNRDNYPVVRGVAMRQLAYPKPADRVTGLDFQYDEDLIIGDAKNSFPVLALP